MFTSIFELLVFSGIQENQSRIIYAYILLGAAGKGGQLRVDEMEEEERELIVACYGVVRCLCFKRGAGRQPEKRGWNEERGNTEEKGHAHTAERYPVSKR